MRENEVFGQIYKNILQMLVTLVNAESIPVTLLVLTNLWPSQYTLFSSLAKCPYKSSI